jgi:hypothetical protein
MCLELFVLNLHLEIHYIYLFQCTYIVQLNRKVVGRDSSVGTAIATGSMFRGSNPGGGEIFRKCPDRP